LLACTRLLSCHGLVGKQGAVSLPIRAVDLTLPIQQPRRAALHSALLCVVRLSVLRCADMVCGGAMLLGRAMGGGALPSQQVQLCSRLSACSVLTASCVREN